ncbi:MAG: DUF971 domain-containing protein [Chlorobi bacterium CHB2]|nr:DUF971 domain-containing protein [Chlorobi bacterium CHB2]
MPTLVPTAITQPTAHQLTITWSDGLACGLTLQQLRDACPCAACKGETILGVYYPPVKLPVLTPGMYQLEAIEPVGNYAVQVRWGDGHHTGIYTWEQLRLLCTAENHKGE